MENQHRAIKGYRELTESEIVAMNNIKSAGEQLGMLVQQVQNMPDVDQRWVSIARTNLQHGIMDLVRAIAKPTTFIFAFLMLIGCSGGKYYQSWPMESEINGTKYHFHNAVQLNLPATMFHATNSETWLEYCKTKIENPQTDAEFLYPFQDCVREEKYQLTTMGSVASQFVTPVLTTTMYAGSIAYAGHAIGRGLGKSGTQVQQNGGGAQSDSSSSSNAKNMTNSGNQTQNLNSGNHIQTNNNINNIKVK